MNKMKLFVSMFVAMAVAFSACTNINDPDDKKNPKSLPVIVTFETNMGGFTTQNVLGDQLWVHSVQYKYMMITGYVNSVYNANEDWLISPEIDLIDVDSVKMSFDYIARYFGNLAEEATIWVSENYSEGLPQTATWLQLATEPFVSVSDWDTWTTSHISLTSYAGKKIKIAFKYVSTATKAGTWEIKNFKVEEGEVPIPDPTVNDSVTYLYAEDFGNTAVQDGTMWPALATYTGFNTTGKGGESVTYTAEGGLVTVRSNLPSTGYTGASGGSNAMAASGGASLVVNDIAVCGARNLILSFGTSESNENLAVSYKINGTSAWVPLTFTKETTNWGLVDSLAITLPETANTIKLKFVAGTTQFGTRIDDIKITTSDTTSDPVVDPDDGGGSSDGLDLCDDTTAPVTSLIENFDGVVNNADLSLSGWKAVQVLGDRHWQGKIYTSGTITETYIQATAHNGAASNYEYWVITPPLNVDAAASKILSFKTAQAYWTATSSLKVFVLKCDGGTTTQTEITTAYIAKESDTDHAFVSSGEIDLSTYSGTIYIGFQYIALGGSGNSTTFKIDDVWFNNTATTLTVNSQAVTSAIVNEAYSYNITTNVMNPVGNTVVSVAGLPAWAAFTDNVNGTATIVGTPNALGTHNVTITATNNSIVATQQFTLTVTDAPVSGDNLLTNGSFEDWADGKPVGWTMISTSVTGSVISSETTIVLDGSNSCKLDASSASGTVNWAQSVSIVGGKTYQLSMSYYIESGDGTDARIWSNFKTGATFFAEADLIATGLYSILRGPGNTNSSGSSYFPDEKGTWKTYTTTFTAPANADGFDFQFRTYRTAVVYWDKFSLVEMQ